jgi:hypothetical protein
MDAELCNSSSHMHACMHAFMRSNVAEKHEDDDDDDDDKYIVVYR